MLQKGDFLKDENQDLLPDVLDVKIVLPEDADDAMLVAACNLAWRFGMETTGYKGNITADAAYTGNRLVLEKAEQTELVREKEGESVKVSLRGDGEELIAFTSRLCMEFPQINGQRSWKDLLMDMVDDFVLRSADGQLAALKAMQKEQTGEYEVYGSPLWNDTQKKKPGMQRYIITNPDRRCTRRCMSFRGKWKFLKNFWKKRFIRRLGKEAR